MDDYIKTLPLTPRHFEICKGNLDEFIAHLNKRMNQENKFFNISVKPSPFWSDMVVVVVG